MRITRAKALLSTYFWKWEKIKARLVHQQCPSLNSSHYRDLYLWMPLLLVSALVKENPQISNILNTFFHLYRWMFNEAIQVWIQVKRWMCCSSWGSIETWTKEPLLIGCCILRLMDTGEGLEKQQPHTYIRDCELYWFALLGVESLTVNSFYVSKHLL